MTLLADLKRRNVIRMTGLYLIGRRRALQLSSAHVVQAPGPQSMQRSGGVGPIPSAACSKRKAVRRPSSITGW